jgi:hypothetical protein
MERIDQIATPRLAMSFSATLFQSPVMALPFTHLLLVMVQLTLLGGVVMFFRPLLIGIARALVLLVRPRPTKDELAARRKLRAAADVGVVGSH